MAEGYSPTYIYSYGYSELTDNAGTVETESDYLFLWTKDFNDVKLNKDHLGIYPDVNRTIQCYAGILSSDPGRYGSYDLSNYETHDPWIGDFSYITGSAMMIKFGVGALTMTSILSLMI